MPEKPTTSRKQLHLGASSVQVHCPVLDRTRPDSNGKPTDKPQQDDKLLAAPHIGGEDSSSCRAVEEACRVRKTCRHRPARASC
ncbi:hypothetical protein GCM10010496_72910 [Streptomyces asoensis]|nr:hypothetical protein GCM10010496_72910 [Streptomyces asoensis]